MDKKSMLEKMLMSSEKPSVHKMDEKGIAAKVAALQDILSTIEDQLSGQVKSDMSEIPSMKKVSVMAPDEKSLTQGLELAQKMAAEKNGPMVDDTEDAMMSDDDAEESSESVSEKESELKDPSLEAQEPEHAMEENDEDTFAGKKKKFRF